MDPPVAAVVPAVDPPPPAVVDAAIVEAVLAVQLIFETREERPYRQKRRRTTKIRNLVTDIMRLRQLPRFSLSN